MDNSNEDTMIKHENEPIFINNEKRGRNFQDKYFYERTHCNVNYDRLEFGVISIHGQKTGIKIREINVTPVVNSLLSSVGNADNTLIFSEKFLKPNFSLENEKLSEIAYRLNAFTEAELIRKIEDKIEILTGACLRFKNWSILSDDVFIKDWIKMSIINSERRKIFHKILYEEVLYFISKTKEIFFCEVSGKFNTGTLFFDNIIAFDGLILKSSSFQLKLDNEIINAVNFIKRSFVNITTKNVLVVDFFSDILNLCVYRRSEVHAEYYRVTFYVLLKNSKSKTNEKEGSLKTFLRCLCDEPLVEEIIYLGVSIEVKNNTMPIVEKMMADTILMLETGVLKTAINEKLIKF